MKRIATDAAVSSRPDMPLSASAFGASLRLAAVCAVMLSTALDVAAGQYDLHTRALTPIAEKPAPAGKPLRLVEAGEVKFPIVTDDAKRDADAVALLREVFEKTTGRAPEVLSPSAAAGRSPRIVLAADAALPKEGFSIRTSEGALTISGHTYYGALDFAERFLGVRWFFPGENGAIYPPCRDLVVFPVWYEDAPWFQSRGNLYALSKSFRGKAQEEKWSPYMGAVRWKDISDFAKLWRNGGSLPGGGSHNPRPEMIAQAHPDKLRTIFYTSPNGKFWYNPKAHLGNYYNVLDLGFADLLVDDWKRYIASGYSKSEDRGGFKGQINDTFVTFGVCDTSMPLGEVVSHPLVKELNLITEADLKREKYSAMAGIYARFFQYLGRRVEQELPGRRLFLLCYYNAKCASLDPRWKLPSNVEVNLCDERFPLRMRAPKLVEEMRERYREWYDALGGRPVLKAWLYSGVTPFGRALGPEFVGEVPKALGKYMGRGGLFYDFTGSQDLWHNYYSVYVAWRSQWNPEFDVDAAIDEMWDLCLGAKAGAKMKDFHRELKAAFVKYQGADGADVADPSYPTAVIDRLESLLAEAEALLAPGSVEMKRFRLVADFWPEAFRQQRAKASYRPPVYGVRRLASGEAPSIDGSPDEPVWEKAPVLPLMDRFSGDAVAYGGEVRLLWDDRGVYAAFKSRDGAPRTDGSMWDNDTIEFYFSHGLGKEMLNLLAFDATGAETTQRQRLLPIPQPKDLEWKAPGHVYRAKTSADGWTAELFVPFSAFEDGAPRGGDEWNFNFAWTGRAAKPAKSASYSLTGAAHRNLP
ncbi:MAG: hypothetical protein IJI35_18070, partial [Kiritimatiellae bacterium]|nr:hypothetical protein [Kiritimatiellia bacterium]